MGWMGSCFERSRPASSRRSMRTHWGIKLRHAACGGAVGGVLAACQGLLGLDQYKFEALAQGGSGGEADAGERLHHEPASDPGGLNDVRVLV